MAQQQRQSSAHSQNGPPSSAGGFSITGSRRPSLASFPSQRKPSYYDVMPSATYQPVTAKRNNAPRPESYPSRKRKARSQYPPNSPERHVEYILVASFDIDRGSIMERQYPAPIGGDEQMLAELMLPDQTHLRSQDWTIFFLHKDESPDDDLEVRAEERKRRREARAQARKKSGQFQDADVEEDDDEGGHTEDEESEDDALKGTSGPPLIYVLNLVNTKQDETVKRGAVVKSMAICTRHSFLHIYKPLLLLALEEYFRSPTMETLASLYDSVNSMDLSLLPRLSFQERYILQASDVKDMFLEKFEAMVQQRVQQDRAIKDVEPAQQSHNPRQRYGLPRDTHEFESVVHYKNVPVPIKIPAALSVETVGDFSIIKLIQTFSTPHATNPQPFPTYHPHLTTNGPLTHPIIVLMNALLTQKRIVFLASRMPSSEVAEAVLAACALVSGGILRGFTRHAFPYTDLSKIDDLLKVPGFIAGVTNPQFANVPAWWDILCDLNNGRITISKNIEQAPMTEGVLYFQQNNTSGSQQPHNTPLGHTTSAGATVGAGMGGFPSIPSGNGDPTGDIAFISSVLSAIADRRGESVIRAKFRLWILKFIRIAAAFEEQVYGASAIFAFYSTTSPTSPSPNSTAKMLSPTLVEPDPAISGHGYVWPSNEAKMKELAANATRIDGWTKTRSYFNFIQDFAVMFSIRPIQDLDLQHLYDKLAKLRLGSDSSASIYHILSSRIKTYEQINQLLSVFAYAEGRGKGMFYLALGLFHPRLEVRECVAELVERIKGHEAGRHFWGALGRFEQAGFERVIANKAEREESGLL